jgi:hypothetical protein
VGQEKWCKSCSQNVGEIDSFIDKVGQKSGREPTSKQQKQQQQQQHFKL